MTRDTFDSHVRSTNVGKYLVWRVTIPKDVLDRLKVTNGQRVRVTVDTGESR